MIIIIIIIMIIIYYNMIQWNLPIADIQNSGHALGSGQNV